MTTWTKTRQMQDVERVPYTDRAEWLQIRRKGIGGSDIGAICGFNSYRSPVSVWQDKRGELPETEVNEAMYWGTIHEETIAKEYAKRHPEIKVENVNALLRSTKNPIHYANLDRLIIVPGGENMVLECKTAGEWVKGKWADGVPDQYYLQVQWYLHITGFGRGVLAVLIGGNKYKEFTVERNQSVIDGLVKMAAKFWAYVESGEFPQEFIDGSDDTAEAIANYFGEPAQDTIFLDSPEAEIWVKEYREAHEAGKAAKLRKDDAANHLKVMLGNEGTKAEVPLSDSEKPAKVTWSYTQKTDVDTKKYLQDHPVPDNLLDQYTITKESRRFTVS